MSTGIQVTVCCGPTCSQLGASTILAVTETLSLRHPGKLDVQVQHCFSRCQQNEPGLCPSVCIDGEFCYQAEPTAIKRTLRKRLKEATATPTDSAPGH